MSTTTTTTDNIHATTNGRKEVVLFGTSADPPTGDGGHVGIAKALSKRTEFEQIRILPVYCHNFADKRDRLLPFRHRLNMCELAFEHIPRVVVSDCEKECFEQKMKGKQEEEIKTIRVGTAELLEMLMENEPNTNFTFALGADTFMDLTNWKWNRSRDVVKFLDGRFVVLYREGVVPEDVLKERIGTVNRDEGGRARMLKLDYLQDVSSTMIRSTCDVQALECMVAPRVLDYIVENKLYGFADQPM